MKLREYLEKNSLTMSAFARETKIKQDTLNKYKYGIRIPNRENMEIINKVTRGKVTANDFFAG